jgi:hemerythrin-like metal-binding protein
MKWQESYSVGVDKFDYQHKILIDFINQLEIASETGDSLEETSQVLEGLFDYAIFHFGNAEEIFKEYSYPGLKEQQNEHGLFLEKIRAFRKDLRGGDISVAEKINQFLQGWLVEHIMMIDKKYKVFLNSKGVR